MSKTVCPVTKSQFHDKAAALPVEVQGQHLLASPKEFSTGSFGWYSSGKVVVSIDGKPCTVQVGITLIVVGSKEAQ